MRVCTTIFSLLGLAFVKAEFICTGNGVFSSDGQLCYYFFDEAKTFADAQAVCTETGGILAPVKGGFDNAIVVRQAEQTIHSKQEYWLGGTHSPSYATWFWMDKKMFNYSHWETGEPIKSDVQRCLVGHYPATAWSSDYCNVTMPFVCAAMPTDNTLGECSRCLEVSSGTPFCDPGWHYYSVSADEASCYYYIHLEGQLSYAMCQAFDSELVSIHGAEENEFVLSMITLNGYPRIGLLRNRTSEKFTHWTDGTPVTYENWAKGEPSNGKDEDCVQMYHSYPDDPNYDPNFQGTWNDIPCYQLPYDGAFCKKKSKSATTRTE